METDREERISAALETVFGGEPAGVRPTPLDRLSATALRQAYRRRLLETHPDLARRLGRPAAELGAACRRLEAAYRCLKAMLEQGAAPAAGLGMEKRPFRQAGRGLPRRRLRFAEYLYYCGLIGWDQLIGAMVRQDRMRPRFGDLACALGCLDPADRLVVLRERRFGERFGEAARRLGLLDPAAQVRVLREQRRYDAPIGRYFLEQGILSTERLATLLAANREYNRQYPRPRPAGGT